MGRWDLLHGRTDEREVLQMNFLDLPHLRQRVCEAGGMCEGPDSVFASSIKLNEWSISSTYYCCYCYFLVLFPGLQSLGVYFFVRIDRQSIGCSTASQRLKLYWKFPNNFGVSS